jgi:mono/diheme cytochrome c family protein
MAGKHSTWQMMTVKAWILLALLAACDRGVTGGSDDGAKLYRAVCAMCHGPTGKPSEQMTAKLNVRDLTAPELRARITPALVEKQIRSGSQNKLMPSFDGALRDDQIKAIAAYVSSPGFLQ